MPTGNDRSYMLSPYEEDIMPFVTDLARAEMAIAHVDSVMKWPSSNKLDDVQHRAMYGLPAVDLKPMRDEIAAFTTSQLLWHGCDVESNVEYFLAWADIARKRGIGNCIDLAAVAFKWLIDIHKVRTDVSLYTLYKGEEAIHAFLILGDLEPTWTHQFLSDAHTPVTWSTDAVWCDPWRRDWFVIKNDWHRRVRMVARDCGLEGEPLMFRVRCVAFSPEPNRTPWQRVQTGLEA